VCVGKGRERPPPPRAPSSSSSTSADSSWLLAIWGLEVRGVRYGGPRAHAEHPVVLLPRLHFFTQC
jgi:hypothetical protein